MARIPFIPRLCNSILKRTGYAHKALKESTISFYNKGIFPPYYNASIELSDEKPAIYNSNGQKMDIWFIRDRHTAHVPYRGRSKYFLWDNYNIGLDTHFYSHGAMLEQMGKPSARYGLLIEPRSICRDGYSHLETHKSLADDFDVIFTCDEAVLNDVNNARFFPFCAGPWFGTSEFGGVYDEKAYQKKNKGISMVASLKYQTDLHKVRVNLARDLIKSSLVDVYGAVAGNTIPKLSTALSDYRYAVVVENEISDYYFTEKITSCFAAQVIPIYCGARKIHEFFNADGIISIDVADTEKGKIDTILKQCSEKEYLEKKSAVLDNYQRVQKFRNMDDCLFEQYFMD